MIQLHSVADIDSFYTILPLHVFPTLVFSPSFKDIRPLANGIPVHVVDKAER